MHLQSFDGCSVNMVVETDHDGMLFSLEVQAKIPVATEMCAGSLLSIWQRAWPSTRVLSQQLSPLSDPHSSTSSSASLLDACLPAWCGPNKP